MPNQGKMLAHNFLYCNFDEKSDDASDETSEKNTLFNFYHQNYSIECNVLTRALAQIFLHREEKLIGR